MFSQDIVTDFGIEKCKVLSIEREKIVDSDGIQLEDENVIKSLDKEENYKLMGILQSKDSYAFIFIYHFSKEIVQHIIVKKTDQYVA